MMNVQGSVHLTQASPTRFLSQEFGIRNQRFYSVRTTLF